MSDLEKRILRLELIAAKIRRNVLDICMQRGGYAGQGVCLADVAACLYFDEMREDGDGWFYDRFVLSNGHDAIMTYGALAEHGSYTMEDLRTINADGSWVDQARLKANWVLKSRQAAWARDHRRLPASPGASAETVMTKGYTVCSAMGSFRKVTFGKRRCSRVIKVWIIWSGLLTTTICRQQAGPRM